MQERRTNAGKIVVGVDGSEHARLALAWAADEARRRHARLVVLHAWHVPALALTGPHAAAVFAQSEGFDQAGARTVEESLAGVDTDGIDVEVQVLRGTPAHALVEASRDADLVVVGSRGLGGFAGMLLGSVGQQLAHDATAPVVIVPTASS